MNQPATYNKAVIPNSSVITDELNTNSAIAIAELQSNDNQVAINSPIMISELNDCKPMGVATYKTTA